MYKLNLVASVCLCVQAPLHMFVDVYVLRIVSKDKILHLINTLIIICLVGLCLSLHYFLHVVHASSNMPWQTFHLLLWSTTTSYFVCGIAMLVECWGCKNIKPWSKQVDTTVIKLFSKTPWRLCYNGNLQHGIFITVKRCTINTKADIGIAYISKEKNNLWSSFNLRCDLVLRPVFHIVTAIC